MSWKSKLASQKNNSKDQVHRFDKENNFEKITNNDQKVSDFKYEIIFNFDRHKNYETL